MNKRFIGILFLISLSYPAIISSDFISHFNTNYRSTILLNLSANFTAVSGGTVLTNGTNICIGTPITINYQNISNYSPVSVIVECAFNCQTYSSPQSSFPQQIFWLNQSEFNNIKNSFSKQASWCDAYRTPQPPITLAPYNFTSTYKTMTKSAIGISSLGLLCYGSVSAWDNSVQIPLVYTPSITGNRLLQVNLLLSECGMISRAFETNGAMQDCWYGSSVNTYSVTESLNLTYISGPSFAVISPPKTYDVTPNGIVTFVFTLNNTGDMDATITSVTMTEGFTVNSFSPSTVLAGQSVSFSIVATAPDVTPGTIVSPTATVSYSSTSTVIGACGTGSSGDIAIGTVLIGEVDPIEVGINVAPSGIFANGNKYSSNKVNIEAFIDRENPDDYGLADIETNITISIYNSTTNNWIETLKFTGITGLTGTQVVKGIVANWNFNGEELVIEIDYSVLNLSPGVYRVNINSYDPFPKNDNYESDLAYFVIFTAQGCVKRV